jgi:DNA-binding CsgD family transcriptional regulator
VHSIVRTAVHDDIPEAVRGLRHAEAARLLAAEGADADAVCAHLLVCEPAGSAEVVAQLRAAAGRALARGAPESAVAYSRRALAETADVSLRAVLLHELGLAEKVLLDPAAAGHLRESLELAETTARRAVIAADLAELLVLAGKWEAGLAIVHAALDELAGHAEEPGDSLSSAIAHLQAWWARFAAYDPYHVGEFDHLLPELLDTARGRAAGPRMLAGLLAGVLAWRGEPAATVLGLLDHALDGNRLLAQVDSNPLIVAQAVFAAVWLEDPARAEELASELLALSRSRGSVSALSIAAYARAAIGTRRGELVGAETAVRAVIETAQEYQGAFAIAGTLYWSADALIERAGLADIAALATGIKLEPALARTATGAMLQEVRGRLALAAGDYPGARDELQAAAETYVALHQLGSGSCWRSALALVAEDPGEARRLADSDLDAARRAGSPRPAGIALRTRGMLRGGQPGLDDLREAVAVLRESGARLEHARALVELGAALRRANQRSAAREPLRAGLDLAYRCGAGRLAQRAATELRATGARPRRAVLTGLEALTPSERRVAELAAGGMTNPEIAQALFVTLNTVEGHLRHVYQKLAISSRGQLPAALRSAAPPPSMRPGEQTAAVAR